MMKIIRDGKEINISDIIINGTKISMPENAIAYKYACAFEDAHWIYEPVQLRIYEQEGAEIEYPLPFEDPTA